MTISRPIQIFALVALLAAGGLGATLMLNRSHSAATSSPPAAAATHAAKTQGVATHAAATTAPPAAPALTVSPKPQVRRAVTPPSSG
jgi:hypothetical protein